MHIAFGPPTPESSRHPCFSVESPEALLKLQQRVFEHFEAGGEAAPRMADKPGTDSGEWMDSCFFLHFEFWKVSLWGTMVVNYGKSLKLAETLKQVQRVPSTPLDSLPETTLVTGSNLVCEDPYSLVR